MNCFKKRNIFGALAMAMFAAALMSGGCKEVDNTLGLDLVPDDQWMTVRDTVLVDLVDTYMSLADSIPHSNQGLFYLGSTVDPTFGRSVGSGMLQFYPTEFDDEDEVGYFGFGHNPVADSAKIVLFVSVYTNRNASVEQTFNIYPMNELMRPDSNYYSQITATGFDIDLESENLYDADNPLFSFTLKDITEATTLSVKLEPTAAGLRYMQDLVDVPREMYSDTAAFRNQFKGFYIAPAPGSPDNADMYTMLLYDDATGYIASAFELYAHNFEENTTNVLDTVRATYHFTDMKMDFNQLSIARMMRDYTGTPLDLTTMRYTTFDSIPQADAEIQSKLYFQSAAGAFPFFYITDELLEAIDRLRRDYRDGNNDIIINKAEIRFPLTDPTIDKMNAAPGRLGMYHTYKGSFYNILDYAYYTEAANGITLPYGGYIDRYFENYSMNISSYMTRLLRELSPEQNTTTVSQRTIGLGSDFYTMMLYHRQVELVGKGAASDNKIELRLIYTLIPKQSNPN